MKYLRFPPVLHDGASPLIALQVLKKDFGKLRSVKLLMHESLQGATFHVDHVVPQSQGGETTLENLALACPGCNLRKADRTTAVDPLTGEQLPLFHPVRQRWEHFRFKGYEVEGRTAVGRATVAMLDLNHFRRQRIRQVEEAFGLYPPTPQEDRQPLRLASRGGAQQAFQDLGRTIIGMGLTRVVLPPHGLLNLGKTWVKNTPFLPPFSPVFEY